MVRKTWIIEKKKKAIERYNTIFSLDYDVKWGDIEPIHEEMVKTFIGLLPKDAFILDAACGTGKYWPLLRNYSVFVKGIDQSSEMLTKAKFKCEDYILSERALQEIDDLNQFDGIMCIDAMENVFPEEWDVVLGKFYRALKDNGLLYFTVETECKEYLDEAYEKGISLGLPIFYGEVAHLGGYHYYPDLKQVIHWIESNHFTILDKKESEGYYHFLLQKKVK